MNTVLLLAALVLDQLVELSVGLKPRGIEEPCFAMSRGDRLDYQFSAGASLDFNLHYHADEVVFPEDLKDVEAREGSFVAPATGSYCLMWTNKQATPVDLEYRYRVYTEKEE